ncbi:hypothetical protein [Ectothiorhodospira sp. BSL-9]|uniref:hypothetical protein n=1 Tax=Ectothiorhodospira sp. BSL-9 TaxID=1442136 RepID=UPI0012E79FDC|nr:hypothetical protein [Ectothiorhodospira sp. BSL-9]
MDILGLVIGVAGIIASVFFGVKAKKLEERIRRFTWQDVENAVEYIYQKGISEYKPDRILTVSAPGCTIASLLMAKKGVYLPLHVAIPNKNGTVPKTKLTVSTTKWDIAFSSEFLKNKNEKILIVDGASLTGDTIKEVTEYLIGKGFDSDNLRWATLLATELSIDAGKAPNWFRYRVPDSSVYLPWGKVLGPGL